MWPRQFLFPLVSPPWKIMGRLCQRMPSNAALVKAKHFARGCLRRYRPVSCQGSEWKRHQGPAHGALSFRWSYLITSKNLYKVLHGHLISVRGSATFCSQNEGNRAVSRNCWPWRWRFTRHWRQQVDIYQIKTIQCQRFRDILLLHVTFIIFNIVFFRVA